MTREVAHDAGFSAAEVTAATDFNLVYELRR